MAKSSSAKTKPGEEIIDVTDSSLRTEEQDGSTDTGTKGKRKMKRKTNYTVTRISGGRFGSKMQAKKKKSASLLSRIANPVGGSANLVKLIAVAAAAALVYDWMTKGKLLGLFKPGTANAAASVPGAGPGAGTSAANPGVSANASGPMPAQAPLSPNPTAYAPPAGYTPPVTVPNNTPVINYTNPQGVTAAMDIGGDLARDVDQFNTNPRAQKSYLERGANGHAYSIAVLQKSGKVLTWDEWNYYRSAGGGNPVDIDKEGLADQRGYKVSINTYISKAGISSQEAYNYSANVGLGSLSSWLV
jgi:hypothetical protein